MIRCNRNSSVPNRQRRRAAAVVEFAVVLPLLLTILFGIIEYGWVFMVRQTLLNAAREGCRVAVLQTTTAPYTQVTGVVEQVMAPTNLQGYTVSMTHATTASPTETVTVSIPYTNVSLLGNFFGAHNYNLAGTCSMRKEGVGVGS